MNKKQAIIIVTLLALIVCAGILATKAGSPLYTAGDSIITGDDSSTSSTKTTSTFADIRLNKEHQTSIATQNLKTLMDDKNTPAESKKEASTKYTKLVTAANNESRIEAQLKLKGFEDAVCFIEDNLVKVTVKVKGQLTESQKKDIMSVVSSVTNISNVQIETKQ